VVRNVTAWLSKVAAARVSDFHRRRQRHQGLAPGQPEDRPENVPAEGGEERRARLRRRCLEIARGLLPQVSSSDNLRRVMEYLFDAIERQVEDLSYAQIARDLGLDPASVRKWVERGLQRLTARARAAGYTREDFDLGDVAGDPGGAEGDNGGE
jgi:DNA-directed RNA polymerase specialized sigma24 family protein